MTLILVEKMLSTLFSYIQKKFTTQTIIYICVQMALIKLNKNIFYQAAFSASKTLFNFWRKIFNNEKSMMSFFHRKNKKSKSNKQLSGYF